MTTIINVNDSSTSNDERQTMAAADARSTSPINPGNMAFMSGFLDKAFADGSFDKNDLGALTALLGAPQLSGGGGPATQPGGSSLVSQLFNDAIGDNKIDDNDQAALNALLGGGGGASRSTANSATNTAISAPADEGMSDGEFMRAVNNVAAESDEGIGPGEKMMMEQAKRLVEGGGSAADKQTFLDQANDLLTNADGNGDGPKDIDQTNDKEGDMLKELTDVLLRPDAESPGTTGGAQPTGAPVAAAPVDPSALIAQFIDKAYADNKLSDTELQGLQALLGAVGTGGATTTATSSSASTLPDRSFSYDDRVAEYILRDARYGLIPSDVANMALGYNGLSSYIQDDEDQ